ncbi:MAG: methyltransferase domain-containing protein [Anaerolineaceae bacterium]|nr:methyltransferase domain-containing protein [Anaerolineaceae bacterium]
MPELDKMPYSEEQNRTLEHFNERSDYWYEVYQDQYSFASYALRKQHGFVLDLVQRTKGTSRILDVGCGAGVTVLELAQMGYEVDGLDIAPKMIQRAQNEAQRRNLECEFKIGIAEDLTYHDQYYDVVIALGLLGNILDDKPALAEMARVLKPGGRLILTMPNILALDLLIALPKSLPIMLGATRFRQPLRVVGNLGRRLIGRDIKDMSALRFNQCVMPQKFVRHLQQHGFSDVSYYPLTFGPIMPFGLHVFSNKTSIYMSEKITHTVNTIKPLAIMGTMIVYDGWRT